jgi:hypothetical protein
MPSSSRSRPSSRGACGKEATAAAARCGLTETLAKVIVDLDDGTVVRREVLHDADHNRFRTEGSAPSDFSRTPLVLRRADILRFWDTPAELRQMVFVHYFRPGQRPVELPQEREHRLRATRQRAKGKRNDA